MVGTIEQALEKAEKNETERSVAKADKWQKK